MRGGPQGPHKNKVTPPVTDPLNSLFFSIVFLLIRQPLQDFVLSSFSEHVLFVLVFTVFQEVPFVIPMVSSIFFEFPNFEKTDSFNHHRTSSSPSVLTLEGDFGSHCYVSTQTNKYRFESFDSKLSKCSSCSQFP